MYCDGYTDEVTSRGPKGDNIRRFFDSVTTTPQHPDDIMEENNCYLGENTIKSHRRYDPYGPKGDNTRGRTKRKSVNGKTGMIFRLPK